MKPTKPGLVQRRADKTLAYLLSERGLKNWEANARNGYSYNLNLCAAVQTAARLIKYEHIIEVMDEIHRQLAAEEAA